MSTTVLHAPRAAPSSAAPNSPSLWLRVWRALEAHGQRRAANELRRVAARHLAQDPALARRLNDAADFADRA